MSSWLQRIVLLIYTDDFLSRYSPGGAREVTGVFSVENELVVDSGR